MSSTTAEFNTYFAQFLPKFQLIAFSIGSAVEVCYPGISLSTWIPIGSTNFVTHPSNGIPTTTNCRICKSNGPQIWASLQWYPTYCSFFSMHSLDTSSNLNPGFWRLWLSLLYSLHFPMSWLKWIPMIGKCSFWGWLFLRWSLLTSWWPFSRYVLNFWILKDRKQTQILWIS